MGLFLIHFCIFEYMKTTIGLLLFLTTFPFTSYSQKKETTKLTESEFFNKSTVIDTIERTLPNSKGNVVEREIIARLYNEVYGDTLLWWVDRKMYRKDGTIKIHIEYEKEEVTEIHYDKLGKKSFKIISTWGTDEESERIIKLNSLGGTTAIFLNKENFFYDNDILIKSGLTYKLRKEGEWKYFDKETGKLKRIKIYKNGKKIKDNKIN